MIVSYSSNIKWEIYNQLEALGSSIDTMHHGEKQECGTLCGCVFFGVFHQFLLISTKSYNQVQTPSQIASDHVKAWSKSLFSHVYNENHMFFLQPFNALGIYKITYAQS